MLCSSSICLPSTPPAPPFRSSPASPDASRAAWLSSAAAPTCRPCCRPPRPGPWPYHLTLLRHSDRPQRRCRPTGHQSLAIPLGPSLPPLSVDDQTVVSTSIASFRLTIFAFSAEEIHIVATEDLLMNAQIRRTGPYPGVFKQVRSSTIET
jgi:hypothetical protein